eukprot:TRINITY_DN51063_c0_g1_i1.p1 TRINITY_DN51063_c0_g1~~TRINITY_DN51063_c0_g1_i1.p1  ORF type:complete len:897 (+),score=203.94 TRINITY_DN51063_c0_g1_i1:113-2692(+)
MASQAPIRLVQPSPGQQSGATQLSEESPPDRRELVLEYLTRHADAEDFDPVTGDEAIQESVRNVELLAALFRDSGACKLRRSPGKCSAALELDCSKLPVAVLEAVCDGSADPSALVPRALLSARSEPHYEPDADVAEAWGAAAAALRRVAGCTQRLRLLACAAHDSLRGGPAHLGAFAPALLAEEGADHRMELVLSGLSGAAGIPHAPRARLFGSILVVRGTIVRMSTVQPLCKQLVWHCLQCGHTQGQTCPHGVCPVLPQCQTGKCIDARQKALKGKGKVQWPAPMKVYPGVASGQWANYQRLKVQIASGSAEASGRIPSSVDVELRGALCDSAMPGDVVTVAGVVRKDPVSGPGGKGGKNKGGNATQLHGCFLECLGLERAAADPADPEGGGKLSAANMRGVQDICSRSDCFELLTHSLCPQIHGHDLVKAALLLTLLGGSPRASETAPRGDTHMLVVGDPGVGKSQLLRACAAVAPRGVYVCGNSTTASGLTVTLQRDPATGDAALEAGALVLGDQGATCIDEFDKMEKAEHSALLEAMEQQRISIAKAGAVGTLPARTCVIAAANPTGGHYNDGAPVTDNVRVSPALLSRFDLVFILKDTLKGAAGDGVTRHVLGLHGARGLDAWRVGDGSQAGAGDGGTRSLEERLQEWPDRPAACAPVNRRLLRKYITYARRSCAPRLTTAASEILKEYYMTLRKQSDARDAMFVTTRQLESLIRLAQARAKVELRDLVTSDDARDVVTLMKRSLYQLCVDVETGQLDPKRAPAAGGQTQASSHVISRMREVMTRDPQRQRIGFNWNELVGFYTEQKPEKGAEKALGALNYQGDIRQNAGRYFLPPDSSASHLQSPAPRYAPK